MNRKQLPDFLKLTNEIGFKSQKVKKIKHPDRQSETDVSDLELWGFGLTLVK